MIDWTIVVVAIICMLPLTLFGILAFIYSRHTAVSSGQISAELHEVHAIVNSQRTEMVKHIGRLEERIAGLKERNSEIRE